MQTVAATSSPLPTLQTPQAGPRFVIMCLVTLPPLIAALAGSGLPRLFSAAIFGAFVALLPATLYLKRGAYYLAVASAILLFASLMTLPLESTTFSVDRWSTLVMFLLALTAIGKAVPAPAPR